MFIRITDGFVAQSATVENFRVQADSNYNKDDAGVVREVVKYRIYLTPPNEAIFQSDDAQTTFNKFEEVLSAISDASEANKAVCDLRAVLAAAPQPVNSNETAN